MNHATDAKRLMATFGINGDEEQRAQVSKLIVDHIIAAAVEAVEQKYACPECCLVGKHSPGCDVEAVRSDPNLPRRFRWYDTVNNQWAYGCYFRRWNTFSVGGPTRNNKPDWPVEWIDHEPEAT